MIVTPDLNTNNFCIFNFFYALTPPPLEPPYLWLSLFFSVVCIVDFYYSLLNICCPTLPHSKYSKISEKYNMWSALFSNQQVL